MLDFMEILYRGGEEDTRKPMACLGLAYKPPKKFEHGEETLVAALPAQQDGHRVNVYETRMPARFYSVRVFNGTQEIEVSTGSGDEVGELAAKLALEIARGMIDIKVLK